MDTAALEHLGFEIALGTYLISSILFILYFSLKRRRLAEMGFSLALFGFAFQTLALATRWLYAGYPPWISTYEVMSFFAWAIVGAYVILNVKSDYKSVGVLIAPLAFVLLGFASMQPTNPAPLIPALQSIWIFIHVPIIILAYCAFVIAFVASVLYLFKDKQLSEASIEDVRHGDVPLKSTSPSGTAGSSGILANFSLEQLDDLAYKSVAVGFPLLTIGIITGAIWAESAWGSYWSWDPIETWALITWFVYLIYLHAKTQSWSASVAAYIAAFGFLSAICTFLGVGYVLPFLQTYVSVSTGLHGYAGGGAVGGTALFCGIVVAVVLLLLATRKRPPKATRLPSPQMEAESGQTS